MRVLNLSIPSELDAQYGLRDEIPEDQRPVVFIGPYEHHSNELPWRESIADVVVIDEDENGRRVAIRFAEISEPDQDLIVYTVFSRHFQGEGLSEEFSLQV